MLYADPFMMLTGFVIAIIPLTLDSTNFIILTIFIPMLDCILFVAQMLLVTLGSISPLKNFIKSISDGDGEGLSICNWHILSFRKCADQKE
jgi:hypothetical protein